MKNVVNLIETTYDMIRCHLIEVSKALKRKDHARGGVVLNEEGYVLTALQVVPPRTKKIIVRLVNSIFKKVVMVARDDTKHLLILQSEFEGEQPEFEQATFNFSRLANEKELVVEGMEVKCIANPYDMYFPLQTGQVCYNCPSNETREDEKDYNDHAKKTYKCRHVRDINLKERKKYLKDYDLNKKII
ncbi:hypothetical protein RHGRI_024183 [Rhododendron griersonianum]|uniref:Uncharacterized protein n=1 Tax=Rhododendron griersonianum TaxID=479676 RepID=A0AAV6J696_9ERIC|nr:hypothetical protein RHGRI_024183 [Rhododendron griersonianum]